MTGCGWRRPASRSRRRSASPSMADRDAEKRAAAEAAAALVEDGSTVGLGTGSTVAHLLPALARRELRLRCVATSVATEVAARALGLEVEPFERLDRLDIAIDGADQIDPEGWLVKGGGGAHTREKIVAAAADRFVVIADSSKTVERISAPIPLELQSFRLAPGADRGGAWRGRAPAGHAAQPGWGRDRRLPRGGRRSRSSCGRAGGNP